MGILDICAHKMDFLQTCLLDKYNMQKLSPTFLLSSLTLYTLQSKSP